MADKPKLKYRVIFGRNPRTGETILRPQITSRTSMNTDQLVQYAIKGGFVRGQFHDMRGALNGFVEAMQTLSGDGCDVNVSNWLRIHGELTGQVDATRKLTAANGYHVNITALKDLKRDVNEFSWTNVDDAGVIVKIDTLMSVGGVPGVLLRGEGILITGKNLVFDAALGDSARFDWMEGTVAKTASVTPTVSDYAHAQFAWPAAMAAVPNGTEVTLTYTARGGIEGAAEQPVTKTAIVTVEPATVTITKCSGDGEPNLSWSGGALYAEGTGFSPVVEGDKMSIRYTGTDQQQHTAELAVTLEGSRLKAAVDTLEPEIQLAGTTMYCTYHLHGGMAGSPVQTIEKTVVAN